MKFYNILLLYKEDETSNFPDGVKILNTFPETHHNLALETYKQIETEISLYKSQKEIYIAEANKFYLQTDSKEKFGLINERMFYFINNNLKILSKYVPRLIFDDYKEYFEVLFLESNIE